MITTIIICTVVLMMWVFLLLAGLLSELRKDSAKGKSSYTIFLEGLFTKLNNTLETIRTTTSLSRSDLIDLNRHMTISPPAIIADRSQPFVAPTGVPTKVYGLYLVHNITRQQQLILTIAPTLEDAQRNMVETLNRTNQSVQAWLLVIHSSIDVMLPEKKVEPQLPHQRRVGEFINTLAYVKDNFTSKPSEKKIITQIINQIKEKHEHTST